MKSLKSLFAISLASFLMATNVSAAKPIPKANNDKSAVKNEKVSAPSTISQTISINMESRQLTVDDKGQALAVFTFVIKNIGNKPISTIQWLNVYVNNREVVHSQDMQVELPSPLLSGKSASFNLQIPVIQIQEKFRPVFMDIQSKINVYPIDRVVRFDDKKELRDSK